ncbi:MAG: four helix bundle protein [Candidatus Kerfeldbacteria bacterium]|nr:four helix bundle protein [Candidatus Kerfeldbacteria bacterium]
MKQQPLNSYQELIVWQRAMDLVPSVYRLTRTLPKEELYGLSSQIRRCAVGIPSNIAEGRSRGTRRDFVHFLRFAFSSGAELETQIELIKRLYPQSALHVETIDMLLQEIMRMLNSMIAKLEQTPQS